MVDPSDAGFALTVTVSAVVTWLAAILNLHERIENKLFLDRTRKDSNFKRPHIYATLFQIEKCCLAGDLTPQLPLSAARFSMK
jgi:hypothetical protein